MTTSPTMLPYHADRRGPTACHCFLAATDTEDAHARLARACRIHDRHCCLPVTLESLCDFDGNVYRVSLVREVEP